MEQIVIPQFSHKAAQAAQARLDSLAKVPGSLGALEDLVIRLAGITDNECPSFPKKAAATPSTTPRSCGSPTKKKITPASAAAPCAFALLPRTAKSASGCFRHIWAGQR